MTSDKRVQPKELFVTNVFEGTEYVIPIYQRSFAWRKDEIEQLLNDINDVQIELGVKYYLGSLIVNQIGGNRFEVIDGQQRLTTLYLLLAFLKDSSINKYSLSFEVREKSNRALQAIASIKDTKKELDEEPDYSLEIMEGYSVIRKYFEGRLEPFFENFIKKLAAVSIIRTQVPKDIDLNHYFEVMNTRGEQLELHEIVKAKIIGAIKSEDAEKDSKDKMIAATIWDACAQMDKYVQMCFSVARRNKLFGDNWDSFSCDSFDDIREKFKDETKSDETKTTLLAMLEKPQQPNNNKEDEENEDNVRFEAIIRFPNFILQVNEAMSITETDDDAGLDDKQFIESLKGNWSSRDKALAFIYSLLKFRYLFDRYIIKREYVGQNKVEGRWSLKRLECYKEKKKDDNVEKTSILYSPTLDSGKDDKKEDTPPSDNDHLRLLESCLRITYTSPKTMHWIARVIAAINKDTTGKAIIKLLEIYCCNKVADAAKEGKPKFPIERIVFTYLDYVIWRENIIPGEQSISKENIIPGEQIISNENIILKANAKELKAFQFQFRTSIEHFFPQNPINGKTGVDENKKDSFGNLALITISANSKFSNLLPDQKVKTYEDVIKQSPKLMLMKRLLDNNSSKWNNEMVEQHEKDMLELLQMELEHHGITV